MIRRGNPLKAAIIKIIEKLPLLPAEPSIMRSESEMKTKDDRNRKTKEVKNVKNLRVILLPAMRVEFMRKSMRYLKSAFRTNALFVFVFFLFIASKSV